MSPGNPWNPANLLTLSRVPLAFAYMLLFEQGYVLAALVTLSVLELTDLFDGIVARKLNCVSDFGKLVDPFCDSFSRLTVFFTLASVPLQLTPLLPLWMPVVCLLRDLAVAFVRTVAAGKGVIVAARQSGKWKALVQGPVVVAITALAWLAPAYAVAYAPWLMLAATVVTAYSLVDYVVGNKHVF